MPFAGLADGERVTVGLRAEDVRLVAVGGEGRAAAEVVSVLPTGADWYYRVRVGDEVVTVRDNTAVGLSEGDRVWVEALAGGVKVFDASGRTVI